MRLQIVPNMVPEVVWDAEQSEPIERWLGNVFGRTKEEFCHKISCYPSIGIEVEGKPVGGFFVDENNFMHVAFLPEYQGRWGHLFADGMKWAFTVSNTLYALVAKKNYKVRRLIKKAGWQMIWEHELSELYKVTPDTTRVFR